LADKRRASIDEGHRPGTPDSWRPLVPRRGSDPRARLGVEVAEPAIPLGKGPVAHLREQLGGRALAVLDAGYRAAAVTDPLPELRERPVLRKPCFAYLPPEVPDRMEAFEVARTTARQAIAALREEGLIYTVPQEAAM
jgi:hypothetical protein